MKAWQRLGLDSRKVLTFSAALAFASGVGLYEVTKSVMTADSQLLSALVSVLVFYLGCSVPARVEAAAALSQSVEAPAMAVLGSATIGATHSRSKAILLLRSREKTIAALLAGARRGILLGWPPDVAVAQAQALASSSAQQVLRSISSTEPVSIAEQGEEVQAIENSSRLGEETRSPLFVAAAFFVPLLLILYAMMAHIGEPLELAELVVLQVVLLDVAFYFSTSDPKRVT